MGLSGAGFGRCDIGTQVLDGGGFEILQARRLNAVSLDSDSCGDHAELLARLKALIKATVTVREINAVNSKIG